MVIIGKLHNNRCVAFFKNDEEIIAQSLCGKILNCPVEELVAFFYIDSLESTPEEVVKFRSLGGEIFDIQSH
jgi:hypothetical protein